MPTPPNKPTNPKHVQQQISKENAGLLASIRNILKPHKPKSRDHSGHFYKP